MASSPTKVRSARSTPSSREKTPASQYGQLEDRETARLLLSLGKPMSEVLARYPEQEPFLTVPSDEVRAIYDKLSADCKDIPRGKTK